MNRSPNFSISRKGGGETPAVLNLQDMTIWFAFDDYSLSAQAKENLDQVASWMSKDPAVKIQIHGNTCDIGTPEYNLALGEQRANSARKYLESLGISGEKLSTVSYGLERPMVPIQTKSTAPRIGGMNLFPSSKGRNGFFRGAEHLRFVVSDFEDSGSELHQERRSTAAGVKKGKGREARRKGPFSNNG